jgi:O-antigen/teichoic acid export membrane protein
MNLRELNSWLSRHPARVGAFAGWIQQGVSLSSALLLVPVVTTCLPPAEAGIWFVFQSIVGMLSLTDLGFGFAITRQAAFTIGGPTTVKDTGFLCLAPGWHGLAQLFRLTRRLYFFLALGAGLIGVAIFEVIATTGDLASSVSPSVRYCWYFLVIAVTFLVGSGGQAAFLNGLGMIYQTRLATAGYLATAAIGAALAAFLGGGLPAMGAAYAVAAVAHYLMLISICMLSAPKLRSADTQPIPPGSLRSLCKASLPVGGVNIFGSLMYSGQTPLLGFLLGPEKVAPFFVAQKIALACSQAVLHTVTPQMPFFTRQYGAGNYAAALRLMNATLFRTAVMALVASGLFCLLSPIAAKILLPTTEYLTHLPLGLLAIDVFLLTLTVPFAWFVLASGKNPFVMTTVVGGILNLGFCVFLVPRLGVSGIPLSSILAGLVTNHWFAVWRALVLRWELGAGKSYGRY